ncbi:OsmC family protein [Candidatus Caldatribacterium saccharofermentans]|uniref:OsmC family peroxiredoxin n=1 Tax=Candidatus Caldatribacterium saccharofermentans TaxID=1454753 RepID=A0A7V4WLT7_9BACT
MGVLTFRASGEWAGGLRVDAKVRHFSLSFDEPPSLGGKDSAPNPVEGLLASLVGCLGIVTVVVAREKNLPVEGVSIEVEGDLDPRGFMGQYDVVRPGFLAVRFVVKVRGKLSSDDLAALLKEVEKRCPVSDVLSNGTRVEGKIESA